jgi:hypothetical protein
MLDDAPRIPHQRGPLPHPFLSGALYPTTDLPMRGALHRPTEFTPLRATLAIGLACALAFVAAALLFDPERRFTSTRAATRS